MKLKMLRRLLALWMMEARAKIVRQGTSMILNGGPECEVRRDDVGACGEV